MKYKIFIDPETVSASPNAMNLNNNCTVVIFDYKKTKVSCEYCGFKFFYTFLRDREYFHDGDHHVNDNICPACGEIDCCDLEYETIEEYLKIIKPIVAPRFGYKYKTRGGEIALCDKPYHDLNHSNGGFCDDVIFLMRISGRRLSVWTNGQHDNTKFTDNDIVEEIGPIEKAFDPTKPVKTRGGKDARIICTDAKDPLYPIVALVLNNSTEYPSSFTKTGKYFQNNENETDDEDDLINMGDL